MTRTGIGAWFSQHAETPLRLLAAPAGAGKTTAIVQYLGSLDSRSALVTLRDDDAPEQLRERVASALDIGYVPASFEALLAVLDACAPCTIAIDDADLGTPETLEELMSLVNEAPDGVSFIYAVRSRASLDASSAIARGLAVLLDDNQLALDADDVARLCEAVGVAFTSNDVARLLEETEGWPLVCHWVIRDAAAARSGLSGAYERWRRNSGRHFIEFLDGELKRAGDTYRLAFRTALSGTGTPEERDRLAFLESRGLFVRFTPNGCRPYRVARQFDLESVPATSILEPEPTALLVVRMFGRFEAEIGGRRIEWIRRREAQIFKYLLLKPEGSASRQELREVFWPEANAHLATQSIRTASSNIRKAFARIVGYGNVDRYFTSRGDMGVDVEHAVIDTRRFTAHVADGDADREAGRTQEALAHYRAAEALYGGELLSGDYPEPWYAPRAEIYRALYLGVLERLADIYTESGRERRAREYADRAAELRSEMIAAADDARGIA